MTSRIILTGKNREFRRVVMCRSCNGDGYYFATSNNPSEPAFKVSCDKCDGEGGFYVYTKGNN